MSHCIDFKDVKLEKPRIILGSGYGGVGFFIDLIVLYTWRMVVNIFILLTVV